MRNKNHDDITPLMMAATEESALNLLKMLSSDNYRSTLFITDRKGRTALDWARMCRNYLAVTLILKAMSTNIADSRLDAITSTIDLTYFINETNKYQNKQLLLAIKNRHVYQAKRILLENILYRNEVEGIGNTFFTDISIQNGYTPLILAAGLNMVEIVNILLDYKTPIDKTNRFGHTALTYAAAGGHSTVIRLLLFNGAKYDHRTNEGRTCLHYACLYAKAKTVGTIFTFLFEKFSTFRTENHSQTDFDPTRWNIYSNLLEDFINVIFFYSKSNLNIKFLKTFIVCK
jgi:ankyrin repeat protein